jgi:hypothetical protein
MPDWLGECQLGRDFRITTAHKCPEQCRHFYADKFEIRYRDAAKGVADDRTGICRKCQFPARIQFNNCLAHLRKNSDPRFACNSRSRTSQYLFPESTA